MNKDEQLQFALLLSIFELGGSAKRKIVLEHIYQKKYLSFAHDQAVKLSSGDERWKVDVSYARKHLFDLKLLNNDSGYWAANEKSKNISSFS